MKRQAMPALTGIRFFAAFAVLCLHYFGWVFPAPLWAVRVAALGGAGVSLFFVLSGFILTYNYRDDFPGTVGRPQLASFVRARFARVYPMHLVALLAITPLTLYLAWRGDTHPDMPGPTPGGGVVAAAWLSQLALFNAWVPNSQFFALFNPPCWSIAAEAVFYMCFPYFVARFVRRSEGPLRLLTVAACLYAIEVAVFVTVDISARHGALGSNRIEAVYLYAIRQPLARIWEFFIGCAICGIYLSRPKGRAAATTPAASAAVAVAVAWIAFTMWLSIRSGKGSTYLEMAYIAFTPAFALLIYGLARGRTFLSPVLEAKPVLLLGEASYALYLIHWGPKIALEHHYGPARTPPWLGLLAMAGCVLASIAALKFVEKPARDWLRHKRPSYPATLAAVVTPNAEP